MKNSETSLRCSFAQAYVATDEGPARWFVSAPDHGSGKLQTVGRAERIGVE